MESTVVVVIFQDKSRIEGSRITANSILGIPLNQNYVHLATIPGMKLSRINLEAPVPVFETYQSSTGKWVADSREVLWVLNKHLTHGSGIR